MHPFDDSGTGLSICRECHLLYHRVPVNGLQQRCRCDGSEEATWPGYDFNERIHLCRLCHQELLPSGSRFSLWFCTPCKELVVGFNDRMRRWLIPTGRHSFMVRGYEDPPVPLRLAGPVAVRAGEGDLDAEQEVDRFVTGLLGMSSSIDLLHEWSGWTLERLFGALGFPEERDVDVPEFLQRLRSASARDPRLGREALFGSLTAVVLEQARRGEEQR